MLNNLENKQAHLFIESVYRQYRKVLLSIIYRYVGDYELCNDIYQDVFLQVIRKADVLVTLDQPQLEAYLIMIARGVAIDYLKKNRYKEQIDLADDVLVEIIEKQRTRSLDIFPAAGKVELKMILQDIPADDLILLLGKYYLGLSIVELATILGSNSGTIKSRLHRARKRVANKWQDLNLRMEDFLNEY